MKFKPLPKNTAIQGSEEHAELIAKFFNDEGNGETYDSPNDCFTLEDDFIAWLCTASYKGNIIQITDLIVQDAKSEILKRIAKAKKDSVNPNALTKRGGDYRIGLTRAVDIVNSVFDDLIEQDHCNECQLLHTDCNTCEYEPKQQPTDKARLREKFFAECTTETPRQNELKKVNLAPHDMFEWFWNNLTDFAEQEDKDDYTNNVAFWQRLKMFVSDVQAGCAISEEEKEMIIKMSSDKINKLNKKDQYEYIMSSRIP